MQNDLRKKIYEVNISILGGPHVAKSILSTLLHKILVRSTSTLEGYIPSLSEIRATVHMLAM